MTGTTELAAALEAAGELPHGSVRLAATERLVEEADALGDPSLVIEALTDLTEALAYGGEDHSRLVVPVSRRLRMWDRDASAFSPGQADQLMCHLEWAAVAMLHTPEIPWTSLVEWQGQVRSRHLAAGWPLASLLCNELRSHLQRGDLVSADAAAEALLAEIDPAGRDHGFHRVYLGEWHLAHGRDEEAVAVLTHALEVGDEYDARQVYPRRLLPLVRLGRLDEARSDHLHGYRLNGAAPDDQLPVGLHLEFAARTGNEARGLEILSTHRAWLEPRNQNALDRLNLLCGAVPLLHRLVELGQGHLSLPGAADAETLAALAVRLEADALDLADRFDRRSGSTALRDDLVARLAAGPLVDVLPLGVGGRLPTGRSGVRADVVSSPAGSPAGASAGSPASAPRSGADLLAEARDTYARDGEEGAARELALAAVYWADGVDDQVALEARLLAVDASVFLGCHQDVPALVEAVLPDLRREREPEQVAWYLDLYSCALAEGGEADAAAAAAVEAAQLTAGSPWPEQRARYAHQAGSRLSRAGRADDAVMALEVAAAEWLAAGQPDDAIRATRAIAWEEYGRAEVDWGLVIRTLDEALALSRAQAPDELGQTLLQYAQLLGNRIGDGDDVPGPGTADRGLELAEEAVAVFRRDERKEELEEAEALRRRFLPVED